MAKLSLVIPAYNEAGNIGTVVRNLASVLREIGDSFEIVLVDNGSIDDTPKVSSELSREVPELITTRVFPNEGYGNGVLHGLKKATGEILGWMHADHQVSAEDVAAVYQNLKGERLDFCKAFRINRNEHWMRIVQSVVYNLCFRLLFNGVLRDINSTPKIFRRPLYEKLNLCSRDWFIDPEIVIKAMRHGARMGEVGVHWGMRPGGSSHVSMGTWIEFVKNMIKYKLGIYK